MKKIVIQGILWLLILLVLTEQFNPIVLYCGQMGLLGIGILFTECSIVYLIQGFVIFYLVLMSIKISSLYSLIISLILILLWVTIIVMGIENDIRFLPKYLLAYSSEFFGSILGFFTLSLTRWKRI